MLKVKNRNNMFRDPESKAIVIDDELGLNRAKAIKDKINKKNEKIERHEQELSELRDQIDKLYEIVLKEKSDG
jgi:hypothetical protein